MDLTESLRVALQTLPQVRLAVLFGSLARGNAGVDSDADVAVIVVPNSATNRADVEVALGRVAQRGIDLIDLTVATPLVRFEIARDGVVLCERLPNLWADFRAHAMIDWWDWGYTAARAQGVAISRLRRQSEG